MTPMHLLGQDDQNQVKPNFLVMCPICTGYHDDDDYIVNDCIH